MVYVNQLMANWLSIEGDPGEQQEALRLAREAVQTGGTANAFGGIAVVALARAHLTTGQLDEAEAHAHQACGLLRAMGMRAYYAHADATLLEVLLHKRDPAAAALADEALRTAEEVGIAGFSELPLRLAAARAHLAVDRRDDAVKGITRALAGLARRVATIPEAKQRARYIALPEHRALCDLGEALGLAAALTGLAV